MRVQFQVSPHATGTVTLNTQSMVVEEAPGPVGVGVTTFQVERAMETMFANRAAWIPSGFESDLLGLIARTSIKIRKFPPFGTDGRTGNITREFSEFGGLYYRVDVENLTGFNLKE